MAIGERIIKDRYEALKELKETANDHRKYDWGIHSLPTTLLESIDIAIEVMEQTRWIPCSKRLPKRSGEYFVSVIDGSGEDNDYEAVGVAWFAHKKDYDIKESEWRELGIDETVIAWMPLPKPYEPQERSDKCSKCEYYINPDYTRCKECCDKESEDKE